MQMTHSYASQPISLDDVVNLTGVPLLERGKPWCGHCQIVQPMLAKALADQPPM